MITQDVTVVDGCDLDFGTRAVEITGTIDVEPSGLECSTVGEPKCCEEAEEADFCGGAVHIHAGALTVACSGRITAPDPGNLGNGACAGDGNCLGGGLIVLETDGDLTVEGRILANGRDEGGTIQLLPSGNLTVGKEGCAAGEVQANGGNPEASQGGIIVFGESDDDTLPRTKNASLIATGRLQAIGSSKGEGGTITGRVCGAISVGANAMITASGGQGFPGMCADVGGCIELAADTLTMDGVIRGGAIGCKVCSLPLYVEGKSCSSNADCEGSGQCVSGVASGIDLTANGTSITGTIDPGAGCYCGATDMCGPDHVCLTDDFNCCGNDEVDPREQCDSDTDNPSGACPGCYLAVCGDDVRRAGVEQCDGEDLGGETCASRGYQSGTLGCTPSCTFDTSDCAQCGDGSRQGSEQCDGSDLGGASCQTIPHSPPFSGGQLSCNPNCTFNTSTCTVCGDGIISSGEVCDGTNLGGATCQSRGYPGGTLRCGAGCHFFDETDCFICGNGRKEGTEQCDGTDLGGAACNQPGETGGSLSCTAQCTIDRSTCYRCGNGRVDPGEQCDDGNTVDSDGCRNNCTTNCGNGTVEQNEECDDSNRTGGDGCSALCAMEQPFGGGALRQDCAIQWGVTGGPDSTRQECADGDPACDVGTAGGECTFQVFYCFNVANIIIGGGPDCTPTDVAGVELRRTSLLGRNALTPPEVDAFLGALSATLTRGGSSVTRTETVLTASPPMSARRQCGKFALRVPLRQGNGYTLRGRRKLSLQVTDSLGVRDRDGITFFCSP